MTIVNHQLTLETGPGITIHNLTPQLQHLLKESGVRNGQVLVFARHTTTALSINEDEERLLDDIQIYLRKLAPAGDRYRHNDLHLRDVPPDEPINAHSHLMAITLNTSEVIPVIEGALGLGTYQSVLMLDLDGPRQRTVWVQVSGE